MKGELLARRRIFLPGLLLTLTASACSPATPPGTPATTVDSAAIDAGAATITAADMFRRISVISDDSLAGRDTPSAGLETAAAYLVGNYQAMGFEPAGESSTFYQRYPFTVRRADFTNGVSGPVEEEEAFPPNVIAVWPGSDPTLADEFVVLSAHFDHVGVGVAVNGDSIYNGADDNGTGTSALLEVAEAISSLPVAPRRSVIFLHVSGEEHGLLGSEWFSDHPTVPLQQIVANVNVDMIGRNSPDTIVAIGKDYSSLGATVNRAGTMHPEIGLAVADDMWPRERFFYRSDHFNFARKEVPAIFFFAGVHEDYHRPSDTVDKIDTDKAARVARLIYYTVLDLADADERPVWDPAGLAEVRRLTR